MDIMQERYQLDPAIIPTVMIGLWHVPGFEQALFGDEFEDDILDLEQELDIEAPAPSSEPNPLELLVTESMNQFSRFGVAANLSQG
jgi:hypothetical protein